MQKKKKLYCLHIKQLRTSTWKQKKNMTTNSITFKTKIINLTERHSAQFHFGFVSEIPQQLKFYVI